jgi:hypothetical protein
MTVHKFPLKTRPIVSCSGTLLYYLGIWVDDKLQKIAKRFKSNFELKQEITAMELPPNATVFTADAVSMYTNIHTETELCIITRYLIKNEDMVSELLPGLPVLALTVALQLIRTDNVFRFGDTHWIQLLGTAMGTPPTPPYATLFFAIYEDTILKEFDDNLLLYRHFIDDVFGVWIERPDDNNQFQLFTSRLKDHFN